jgi:outer membrane protein assembly factor BamA
MKKTTNQMNIRHRTARLDGSYSWNGIELGNLAGAITTGAGVYNQDYYVLAVHEEIADDLPRMDVTQEGAASYVSLAYSGAQRDMIFTPHEGHYFVARAEQHFGDFNFSRFQLDVRKYVPVGNVFGHREQQVRDGTRLNIARQFPTASFAAQVQSTLETGDVPFSQEVRLDTTHVARGFLHDSHAGTKLVSGRVEYRLDVDSAGEYEMYLFSDHAGLGETLSDMEGFHSWGVGSILTVPIYGGFKLGGYYGFSYDGADDGWGLAFGYQF